MLLRGQNLVGYRHYADDVLERFVERSAANGIDVFRIFDALNDVRNVDRSIREVKACGKHAEAAISYTVSPVHSIDRYVDLAKQLEDLGTDTLCIKDMAGLLAPLDAYQSGAPPESGRESADPSAFPLHVRHGLDVCVHGDPGRTRHAGHRHVAAGRRHVAPGDRNHGCLAARHPLRHGTGT